MDEIVHDDAFMKSFMFYPNVFSQNKSFSKTDKQRFVKAIALIWDEYFKYYANDDFISQHIGFIQHDIVLLSNVDFTDFTYFDNMSICKAILKANTCGEVYHICSILLNGLCELKNIIANYSNKYHQMYTLSAVDLWGCYNHAYANFDMDGEIAVKISDVLLICKVDVVLKFDKNSKTYGFYPVVDADIHDGLIDFVSSKLVRYPESKKLYDEAVSEMTSDIKAYVKIDMFRKAFEEFLKEYFGNDKSFENQISNIGTCFKNHGLNKDVCNAYDRLINIYKVYVNDHGKHGLDANECEVDMIFYLTACFIRFLLKLND